MPAPPLRFLPAAPPPPITDGKIERLLIERLLIGERDAMDAAARRIGALIDHLRARESAAAAPFSRETGEGARRADEGESRP